MMPIMTPNAASRCRMPIRSMSSSRNESTAVMSTPAYSGMYPLRWHASQPCSGQEGSHHHSPGLMSQGDITQAGRQWCSQQYALAWTAAGWRSHFQ